MMLRVVFYHFDALSIEEHGNDNFPGSQDDTETPPRRKRAPKEDFWSW